MVNKPLLSEQTIKQFFYPSHARVFTLNREDHIGFGTHCPLPEGSEWSVAAMIYPTSTKKYAGVISKRSSFSVGGNQFTVWLKEGLLCVEADNVSWHFDLTPPLKEWSVIGVTVSESECVACLGTGGIVKTQIRSGTGLVSKATASGLPLVIGRLGDSFPGSIAWVCLYAEPLAKTDIEAVCAGKQSPTESTSLAFAWAAGLRNVDVVSNQVATVVGTDVVPILRNKLSNATSPDVLIPKEPRTLAASLDRPPVSKDAESASAWKKIKRTLKW